MYDPASSSRSAIPSFLCDEMLARLGRWLRGAGYDTRLAEAGANDRALMTLAVAEDRLLVTADRSMMQRSAAAGRVIVLTGAGVEAQARELGRRCAIDWLYRPFSRCLMDNAELRPAGEDEVATAPPGARACGGPYRVCPRCARLYWPGSHYRRMLARLESWQQGSGAIPASRPAGCS